MIKNLNPVTDITTLALSAVLGALDSSTATGAVTSTDLVMAYIKQIVTEGIARDIVIGNIPTTMRGTDSAAIVADGWDSALATILDNFTAARIGDLDELAAANVPADIDGLKTSRGRMLLTMDFWSDTQEELLINATAGDKSLPTVTVAGLPAGATIVRAIAMFKFRMVENVYAGVNAINVAQHIQVRDDTPGTFRDAISIADNLFNFSEAAREGGDILIGDHDIAVEVDADDGYNFQWTAADADQISINFNDIQVGLRIWYSV